MNERGGTKACTACYWHHIVTRDPDKAGLHACVNPAILDQTVEEVIEPDDGDHRYINCDIARRMGQICGPHGAQWAWGDGHAREMNEIGEAMIVEAIVANSVHLAPRS